MKTTITVTLDGPEDDLHIPSLEQQITYAIIDYIRDKSFEPNAWQFDVGESKGMQT